MAYQYRISPRAEKSFRDCLEYLLYKVGGTGNIQAGQNFLNDFQRTVAQIKDNANSYPICEGEKLQSLCIRKIHFKHMKYKIFFHLDKQTVVIDLICHDLQDYENLF